MAKKGAKYTVIPGGGYDEFGIPYTSVTILQDGKPWMRNKNWYDTMTPAQWNLFSVASTKWFQAQKLVEIDIHSVLKLQDEGAKFLVGLGRVQANS